MEFLNENSINPVLLENLLHSEETHPGADEKLWEELERRHGDELPRAVLYLLTRKEFDAEAAHRHWLGILAHRRQLRQALGRDVGLRASLCDYFINIQPDFKKPLLVERDLLDQREQNALVDELTGLFNRRFFNSVLAKQVATAQRFGQTFSLLMLDVDRFKLYNDTHGHLAGDRALADMARLLQLGARDIDYVVRYGGEEFVVILPQANKEQALTVAERHRWAIRQHPFPGEESQPGGHLTVSLGVATYPVDARDARSLVAQADLALYQAKRHGRDQAWPAEPERRRHPRAPFEGQVDIRHRRTSHEYLSGRVLDISLSGLRLASPEPVIAGQSLDLVLHAPQGDVQVRLQGRAVHLYFPPGRQPTYHLGVALDDQPDETYHQLVSDSLSRVH